MMTDADDDDDDDDDHPEMMGRDENLMGDIDDASSAFGGSNDLLADAEAAGMDGIDPSLASIFEKMEEALKPGAMSAEDDSSGNAARSAAEDRAGGATPTPRAKAKEIVRRVKAKRSRLASIN